MMRVLIADDDRLTTTMLTHALANWELFEASVAHDGESAWQAILAERPQLAILDWMMPGVEGPALCRRIRADPSTAHLYVILLTARDSHEDLVAGLDAGADDYLIKPFDHEELRARLNVGARVVGLQRRLAERVSELEAALSAVKQLQGMIPICSYCKRIRSDRNDWEPLESYISEHSEAQFSHGICPSCLAKEWGDIDK
jgi:DNA-binding response OmpR family regulator